MYKSLLVFAYLIHFCNDQYAQGRIILEVQEPHIQFQDSIKLRFAWKSSDHLPHSESLYGVADQKGIIKWIIEGKENVFVRNEKYLDSVSYFLEAGDSVRVSWNNNRLFFSGKGAAKMQLLQQFLQVERQSAYQKPDGSRLEKFGNAMRYTNSMYPKIDSVYSLFSTHLSPIARKVLESTLYYNIETRKIEYFWVYLIAHRNEMGLSTNDWVSLFDRELKYSPIRRFMDDDIFATCLKFDDNIIPLLYLDYFRSVAFDSSALSATRLNQAIAVFNFVKNKNGGIAREIFLHDLLSHTMVDKIGFVPEVNACIEQYLDLPGYPGMKTWMKDYVAKAKGYSNGAKMQEFTLYDLKDQPVKLSQYKGKVILFDFWFTGCTGCVPMAAALKKLETRYTGNSNVVFLSISIDKSRQQWNASLITQKYTSGSGIQVYTGGQGDSHAIVASYQVSAYPRLFLVDAEGYIIQNPAPDPRSPEGFKQLSEAIDLQVAKMNDGPHIIYKGDELNNYQVKYNAGKVELKKQNIPRTEKRKTTFSFATDNPQVNISFLLKDSIQMEPDSYAAPRKLVAISDIEGNFTAFRKLLIATQVIDSAFNWTFGDGHLVLTGDFVDRGIQVTECLWFIYYLEQKAKEKGGYVHFILGNHEIMNLSGEHSYVQAKYTSTIPLFTQLPYRELFMPNTELGQWLRSKNIVEKIGDLLFVHGGISVPVLQLSLPISKINDLAKPYLDKDVIARNSTDSILRLLFHSAFGPFWYRRYYKESSVITTDKGGKIALNQADDSLITATLKFFGVGHIVTGHTIIGSGENITTHFNGRIINTDTHHSEGKSEALFVEGNQFFRIDTKGRKVFLFSSD